MRVAPMLICAPLPSDASAQGDNHVVGTHGAGWWTRHRGNGNRCGSARLRCHDRRLGDRHLR